MLVIGLGLGVAPLLKVLAVPDNRVAVRAVCGLNGQQAHREVLPDVLAQVDVGHGPARQHLGIAVVHAGDEDDLLLGLRRVCGQPHLRQLKPANLVAVHGGHDGVSHQVAAGKVLNCNGHLGRKGKGRKAGRKGRKESWKACVGVLTALSISAPHQPANKKIGYSIFSDFCIVS